MAKHYKNSKKDIIFKIAFYTILFLFIYLIIMSSNKIFVWYKGSEENKEVIKEIEKVIVKDEEEKEIKEQYSVDFNKLKEMNSDSVCWIKVNNTNIETVAVKAKNNEYYLNRNFNRQYNPGGWVFADYKNKFDGTDKNIILYGHNMKDDSMFGTLKNVLSKEWYNNPDNYNILFITENEKAIYQVFSVYKIENEDYYIKTNFKNDKEYKKFLDKIKSRSWKNFNVELNEEDSILTLSTCANNSKNRVVLHAKKIN